MNNACNEKADSEIFRVCRFELPLTVCLLRYLLLWWAIVLETMPYRTVQRVRCPLFYIPSPSDIGIVFLLSLTTYNCLLILSPRVEDAL